MTPFEKILLAVGIVFIAVAFVMEFIYFVHAVKLLLEKDKNDR